MIVQFGSCVSFQLWICHHFVCMCHFSVQYASNYGPRGHSRDILQPFPSEVSATYRYNQQYTVTVLCKIETKSCQVHCTPFPGVYYVRKNDWLLCQEFHMDRLWRCHSNTTDYDNKRINFELTKDTRYRPRGNSLNVIVRILETMTLFNGTYYSESHSEGSCWIFSIRARRS